MSEHSDARAGDVATEPQRKCAKTGKVTLTRKESMRQAAWWRRARFARMNHYRCSACKGWHVGNDRRR